MIAPGYWLALLRIVVGAWFVKAVWTKVTLAHLGVVPYPVPSSRFLAFHPKRVMEFAAGNPRAPELAAGNPIGWYREFLEGTVVPHAQLFAALQAIGEVVVGIGLVLGLLTGLAALIGLVLTVNYGLATAWMSFGQYGFHILLITSMVIFLGARAGRVLGLDAWLVRSRLARRWLWLFL